jgi:hypothetical protein
MSEIVSKERENGLKLLVETFIINDVSSESSEDEAWTGNELLIVEEKRDVGLEELQPSKKRKIGDGTSTSASSKKPIQKRLEMSAIQQRDAMQQDNRV